MTFNFVAPKLNPVETLTSLNAYISTSDFNFNRTALKLYFGNVKQPVFSAPGEMLAIFKHIIDKVKKCGKNFFSFVDQYQALLAAQKLTPQQESLICTHVVSYLKTEVKVRDLNYEYAQNYLSYFQTLSENAELLKQEAIIAGAGIGGMLDDLLQKQVMKLSRDLNEVTSAQKVKAITSLVKALPELTKARKENTAPVIKPA